MAKCKHYVEEFDCCAKTSVWVDGLLCTDSCNYRDDVFGEPNCRYFEEKADVVPVVRCKDCKWLYKPSLLCTHNRNRVFNTGVKRDFNCFCNYGEKEDEGNEKDSAINTVFEWYEL